MQEVHEFIYTVISGRIPKKNKMKIRKDGKYTLVLEDNAGILTSLNSTASMILDYCDGKNTINDIIAKIASRYSGIDKKMIRKDVVECVRHLEAMQLLHVSS